MIPKNAPTATGEFELPDTSDLDRWVGVPSATLEYTEPVTAQEVRRWVQAMTYPNPIHYDEAAAQQSRFGRLIAPQSYPRGRANGAALQGTIRSSHASYAGNETWFYGPRIFPGDRLRVDRMLFDYQVRNTNFAGPTVFVRGDATVVNSQGEFISKQRATIPRYLVSNLVHHGGVSAPAEEPEWTDEQIEAIELQKIDYVKQSLFQHEKRLITSVTEGDALPTRVLGPHTIASLAFEASVLRDVWGDSRINRDLPMSAGPGLTADMSVNPEHAEHNIAAADEYLYGGGKGHLNPKFAGGIGIPRCYGMGASEEAWILDYLASWAGEWGFVRHVKTHFRFPVLTGDATYITGRVNRTHRGPGGMPTVEISCVAKNQDGEIVIRATGEVELPES